MWIVAEDGPDDYDNEMTATGKPGIGELCMQTNNATKKKGSSQQ